MKIENTQVTLVDKVEDSLLNYFKENDLRCGDHIPNEMTLASELSVGRSVIREALSRMRMMGLINSRPRKGMVLSEPSLFKGMKMAVDPRVLSEEAILDIIGFRVALEIGMSKDIFDNVTDEDIAELQEIVQMSEASVNNEYAVLNESAFHIKLYNITGNKLIAEFQEIIHPVLSYIKEKFTTSIEPINIRFKEQGKLVTHADLLSYIVNHDEAGYKKAIEGHFEVYRVFIKQQLENKQKLSDNNQ